MKLCFQTIAKTRERIMTQEIKSQSLNPEKFIKEQIQAISDQVGDGMAINALSGGVDSSVVTVLGHRALGDRLKTVFVENGLMREGEPGQVRSMFGDIGISVDIVDAREDFFSALKGVINPEEKREAVTQTFYKKVFGQIVRDSGAHHLLQGTILTDVDETVAGIKRQHNVFEQLGIDPEEAFGYQIIEPLIQLRTHYSSTQSHRYRGKNPFRHECLSIYGHSSSGPGDRYAGQQA